MEAIFTQEPGGTALASLGADRKRDTDELLRILQGTSRLSSALKTIEGEMGAPDFAQELGALMKQRQLTAAELSETALLSRSFIYQLCSGERKPSRDMVLRLALALELSLDDTQRLLRSARRGALYPRVLRDAIVIFALNGRMGVTAADEQLVTRGEASLL